MGLRVNQSQNNPLAHTYFHVGISTHGIIVYWVSCLFLWNCILLVLPRGKDYTIWTTLYPEEVFKIEHLISKSLFSSFKLQRCFDSLVSFFCAQFLNDIVWLLHLDLNSFSLYIYTYIYIYIYIHMLPAIVYYFYIYIYIFLTH